MKPLSLIICASPRSGSYLLSDLLNRSGLPFGDEWLTPFHQGSRKSQYGQPDSLPMVPYLQLLSERERQDGVFVMKLMYPQFQEMVHALKGSPAVAGSSLPEKIANVFPNPRYVYLHRQDTIGQAISHVKARQTRQWVKRDGSGSRHAVEPVYSFISIAQQLEERERNESLWRQFFESNQLNVFSVVFEDLRKDPEGVTRALFQWLDWPVQAVRAEAADSKFKPMSTRLNETWRGRFLEEMELCKPFVQRPPDTLSSLRITGTTLKPSYALQGACRFEVEVACASPMEIDFRGRKDGRDWLRVVWCLKGKNNRVECFQQELRGFGNGRFKADCLQPLPPAEGEYRLRIVISDRALYPEAMQTLPGEEYPVQFTHSPARSAFRKLFPGVRDLPNGWQSLDWFGHFMDEKFPWIYHADHEWLYIKPEWERGNVYHVLDANLGWMEIDPLKYPEVRLLKSGQPLRFVRREKGKRFFQDLATGEIRETETNRPEHLKQLPKG
ncbi:MAG: Stf0 family sulfotransferase [Oceanipulchritudo sp.]